MLPLCPGLTSGGVRCILGAAWTPRRASQVCAMSASTVERIVFLVRQKAGLAPEDELTPDTPLVGDGLWLDSVLILELLLELEDEFGVELAADELQAAGAMGNCACLARFIDGLREGG